jgi:NAD(P)-dependent dehydrogenase (short-subunit alcohol dehydrogenase family)
MSGCNDGCCAPAKKAPAVAPPRTYDDAAYEAAAPEPRGFPAWTLFWLAVEAALVYGAAASFTTIDTTDTTDHTDHPPDQSSGTSSYALGAALAAAVALLHVCVWVALSGGVASFREVLEASTQGGLPPTPAAVKPGAARGKSMLVVGAYSGLGAAVAKLAASVPGYAVSRADVRLHGDEYVDLSDVDSIKQLAERFEGKSLDAVVLCAGVVDGRAVPLQGHFTCDTVLPRMAWVNFLGHAVLMQELEARSVTVARVVVVGSGAYARGSQQGAGGDAFFPREWSGFGAMAAYAQSKFILTAWAEWQRRVRPTRSLSVINPGPMRTTIGDEGVPAVLAPFYGTMQEILFPRAGRAAQAVLHLCGSGPTIPYMHIRKPAQLNEAVRSEACQAWAVENMTAALAAVGYTLNGKISATDPSQKKAGGGRAATKKGQQQANGHGHGHGHSHGASSHTTEEEEEEEEEEKKKKKKAAQKKATPPAATRDALADTSLADKKEKEFGDPDIFAEPTPMPTPQQQPQQQQPPATAQQQVNELKGHIDSFAAPFKLKVEDEAKLKLVQMIFATIAALNHERGKEIIGPILQQLKIENLLHILSHVIATHVKIKNTKLEKPGPPSDPLTLEAFYNVMHLRPDLRHLAMCSGALKEQEMPKRFAVGTYVLVKFSGEWVDGLVIKHNYHEKAWPPERIAAYQIRLLADDNLIFCPLDVDHAIKAHGNQSAAASKDKKSAAAAMEAVQAGKVEEVESVD